jgi:hypothetical protein
MLARAGARGLACILVVVAAYACGDDDDDTPVRDGGMPGKGGRGGVDGGPGGSGGRGGSSGSGGSSGMTATDGGELYQCEPPAAPSGGDSVEGEACCAGMGVCTKNPTGPGSAAYGLSSCKTGEELKCVPAATAESDGGTEDDDGGAAPVPTGCRMTLASAGTSGTDFEGRCVPTCFLSGDPSSANLTQSTCTDDFKCVPCFSPITGESTGACNQPGDAPVEAAPAGFAECGDDTGFCVPMGASGGVTLPQLTCEAGDVCAPKSAVLDPSSCFARCSSALGPGACIPAFIIPAEQRNILMKATCADGELCTPCVSPLDRMRTGACD